MKVVNLNAGRDDWMNRHPDVLRNLRSASKDHNQSNH